MEGGYRVLWEAPGVSGKHWLVPMAHVGFVFNHETKLTVRKSSWKPEPHRKHGLCLENETYCSRVQIPRTASEMSVFCQPHMVRKRDFDFALPSRASNFCIG